VVQELAARPAAGQPGSGRQAGSGPGSALAGLDIGAVVDAARGAPDGAARNAALRLLTAVARAEPGGALAHVLEARVQRSRAGCPAQASWRPAAAGVAQPAGCLRVC